jgi:hypothetical protein
MGYMGYMGYIVTGTNNALCPCNLCNGLTL